MHLTHLDGKLISRKLLLSNGHISTPFMLIRLPVPERPSFPFYMQPDPIETGFRTSCISRVEDGISNLAFGPMTLSIPTRCLFLWLTLRTLCGIGFLQMSIPRTMAGHIFLPFTHTHQQQDKKLKLYFDRCRFVILTKI